MIDLNKFAKEVHDNSVAHGWWEGDRDFAEICALIHSEWSEALEEARANRDMVWTGENGKPEGIAVELIDGVIRILDWIGREGIEIFPATIKDNMEIFSSGHESKITSLTLPQLVARLHCNTSIAFTEDDNTDRGDALISAMIMVFAWLDSRVDDVEAVLVQKHEYNKTRPYKHGKKF